MDSPVQPVRDIIIQFPYRSRTKFCVLYGSEIRRGSISIKGDGHTLLAITKEKSLVDEIRGLFPESFSL